MDYLSQVIIRQCSSQSFLGTPSQRNDKDRIPTGHKIYTDDVFQVIYPSFFSVVKKESALVFHTAPALELLETNKGKYFTLVVMRFPHGLDLNWEDEFVPGMESEIRKHDPFATGPTDCFLLGSPAKKILADLRKEYGLHKPRVSIQVSTLSTSGFIYYAEASCSGEDLWRFKEVVDKFFSRLRLSREGKEKENKMEKSGKDKKVKRRGMLEWLGDQSNFALIQGLVNFLLVGLVVVVLYFFVD
eukprot:TRINITY_DN6438_c0_g1_i6.p1 TRINITY_DN6438_c0_g1~~TRINITY_DN6438_c0_g1_i6.p1  ORF type:complete len:244 (+),score=45.69 TRINITY_DN6438_c0_g1_i6:394-1125(+)